MVVCRNFVSVVVLVLFLVILKLLFSCRWVCSFVMGSVLSVGVVNFISIIFEFFVCMVVVLIR